ncbi:MAG: hypothetical protein AAF531_26300 [Actinomycetota bacterium]
MADDSDASSPVSAASGVHAITPPPSDEEAAAIVAALTMAWPRPTADAGPIGPPSTTWRFSGRWWNKRTWRGR